MGGSLYYIFSHQLGSVFKLTDLFHEQQEHSQGKGNNWIMSKCWKTDVDGFNLIDYFINLITNYWIPPLPFCFLGWFLRILILCNMVCCKHFRFAVIDAIWTFTLCLTELFKSSYGIRNEFIWFYVCIYFLRIRML